jgi:hypothetical protein
LISLRLKRKLPKLAKGKFKDKLKSIAAAKKVVQNLEREYELLKLEAGDG